MPAGGCYVRAISLLCPYFTHTRQVFGEGRVLLVHLHIQDVVTELVVRQPI